MRVMVLGAGIVGTASAWYLARAGHQVRVVDRRESVALETSFANGGQISVSHAEPWANPAAPRQILKWLGRGDAPLLFRLRADWHQWRWGLQFLRECLPARTHHNIRQILALATYSRTQLRELRRDTRIEYDQLQRGILHFYTSQIEFDHAVRQAEFMRQFGLERELKTGAECVAIEPALRHAAERIVGGDYTAADESGDAHKFTQALAALAIARGVEFLFGRTIIRLDAASGKLASVTVSRGASGEQRLTADAYVLALGSYSPLLLRPIGVDVPIYPAKGYSVTLPLEAGDDAPMVSLTDDEHKLVFSRLGDRLRIAGTAELNGYDTALNTVRCEAIVKRTFALFPHAGRPERAQFWTGLRPATPSNVPLIGRTRYPNLFLNTGHGTLGWTMGCGSGRAIADIVSGRVPEVDFRFLGVAPRAAGRFVPRTRAG